MSRQAWTRDQLIKTLSLYCQIPFGRIHARNPAVIELAEHIDRTPSAVALKLVNFASLDPELRKRQIKGMGNTSAADRAIWAEFYGNWDALANNSIESESTEDGDESAQLLNPDSSIPIDATETSGVVAIRRGQSFFRAAVLAANDSKCCITGITSAPLLRASHIIPWSRNPSLRLDPRNGICLNALHDAAFDRGLITFTERFDLRVSKRLKDEIPICIYREMFEMREGASVRIPERFVPTQDMLEFHRRNIFVA